MPRKLDLLLKVLATSSCGPGFADRPFAPCPIAANPLRKSLELSRATSESGTNTFESRGSAFGGHPWSFETVWETFGFALGVEGPTSPRWDKRHQIEPAATPVSQHRLVPHRRVATPTGPQCAAKARTSHGAAGHIIVWPGGDRSARGGRAARRANMPRGQRPRSMPSCAKLATMSAWQSRGT